jgi:DNA-binding PadR family transcriptional regulator
LASFLARPQEWRYGYDLMRETGLKSGTLYPLLMRLHDGGFLQADWRPSAKAGRPPRHAYRLTASGMALARELRPTTEELQSLQLESAR